MPLSRAPASKLLGAHLSSVLAGTAGSRSECPDDDVLPLSLASMIGLILPPVSRAAHLPVAFCAPPSWILESVTPSETVCHRSRAR